MEDSDIEEMTSRDAADRDGELTLESMYEQLGSVTAEMTRANTHMINAVARMKENVELYMALEGRVRTLEHRLSEFTGAPQTANCSKCHRKVNPKARNCSVCNHKW